MTLTGSRVKERRRVIVRFAGDSGDGMQLAGTRFTEATAEHGNDFATLPSFPAEIRAPAGTLAGVSAFQIHFANQDILTPGDEPDVLVAMNPAALRSELPALARAGTVIANEDAFSKRNLLNAGYETNPLEDGSLDSYHLIRIPMTSLTASAVEALEGVSTRDAGRAKNLFALGVVSWLYDRPTQPTEDWLRRKFAGKPGPLEANLAAFRAGWNFGETSELIDVQYKVDPAPGCRSCSPVTRSRRRPSCCTSLRAIRRWACGRSRPRTRSRRPGWRSAPRSAARWASRPRAGPAWI
jgi:2-oxoglutarate ferredoxin oxidoreductase subunit alpha